MTDDFRSWVLKSKEQGHLVTLSLLLDSVWGNQGTQPKDPTSAAIALGEQLTIRRCVHFIKDPIPKPQAILPPPSYGVTQE
jgi:hypothetical protein